MNIIHVIEPFASGTATFVRSLAENLQNDLHIIIHGERESVTHSSEVRRFFPRKNTLFIRWPSAQRRISVRKDTIAFWELYKILRRIKQHAHIDAVHLHSSKSGFLGRLACRMAKISKVIYTPNGAPFLSGSNNWINYLYGRLEKLGSFLGGRTVCCSASEWQVYKDMGIQADCINNGIRLENTLPPVRSMILPQPNKFRIVTSGRIVHQKNPQLFNDIAAWFDNLDQFEFVWIGDGQDRHLLTSRNITVTGWMPPDTINEYVAGAHLYLSTSHFEGLPFSVLEALALKKTVLLNDCVGNKDLVHGGLNGDLFHDKQEAVHKILRYYNNRKMLRVMGEYSRKICAAEFNAHTTYNSYRDLYKN
jgi:glycosyltransferase involved in cell wall biosynthesis